MVGVVGVVDVGGCPTVPTCCPIPVTWPKTFLKMPIATDLRIAQDRDAFQKQALSTDHNAQEVNLVEGWGCGTFSAIQHSTQTQYVIWDCRRVIADCGVSVRMAWPHLPRNPPDYDKQMVMVLSNFLTGVGPFKGVPKSGVLRRPMN
jgi:hypothetical protein